MENIKKRNVTTQVRGVELNFDENYMINEFGEEVYNRDIEIANDTELFNLYKKNVGLLCTNEIVEIREEYGLNQKEYATILGLGEVTINRIEKGSIQSKSIDSMMKMSKNVESMESTLENNKDKLGDETIARVQETIERKKNLDKHKIADIDYDLLEKIEFKTADVLDVAEQVIARYNTHVDQIEESYHEKDGYITHLKLQKLLYYIQGVASSIYGKKAFNEDICAWEYGPVVPSVYQMYKKNGNKSLLVKSKAVGELSEGLNQIIDIVVDSYGSLTASRLVTLTHDESPWKDTIKDEHIEFEVLKNYFDSVYK